MKLSRFNVVVKDSPNLFIYNTLSNGVLRLDAKYAKQFEKLEQVKSFDNLDPAFVENLKKGGMLIDNDIDEIAHLKVMHNDSKYSSQNFTLTIAPTMKCNFVCPYCYEKGRNLHTMDADTVHYTKEYIREIKKFSPYLSISWYGGEPLLAMDIIEDISKYAINLFNENYYSSMVTNGYNLTLENAKKMKELRINDIQITIDGPPDIHNKMRKLPNGKDTFFTILNNISAIYSVYPEVNIIIRVNTDKKNIDRVDEILDYLKEYSLDDRVSLYLAPIDNINNTCENSENCFTNSEFAKAHLDYLQRNFNKGYSFIKLPEPNIPICGAVSNRSIIIDAQGDIYKCWDDVSNSQYKAGHVKNPFELNKNYTNWLLYDPFNHECIECPYLPTCMGGCPNQVIKKGSRKCSLIKFNSTDTIKLLYENFKRKQSIVK